MDALKNITGGGSDKPKAEEPKPGFVASTKLAGEAAHSTVTGAATNVVKTAQGYVKSGQDAVGNCLKQAGEFVKPAAPSADAPKAETPAKK